MPALVPYAGAAGHLQHPDAGGSDVQERPRLEDVGMICREPGDSVRVFR